VSRLHIPVRESHLALSSLPGGSPGWLVVEVPPDPLKDEYDTLIFPWPPEGESRLILKIYRRIGILHWMRKHIVGFRARREFRTLGVLRAASIDCCEAMFWGIGHSPEHGRFEVLATREIPGAVTLEEIARSLAPRERAELVARLFEQLARMHRRGVYHGAPYLANVLVTLGEGSSRRFFILDLEKSICFSRDIRGSRMASFDLLNIVNSTRRYVGKIGVRAALAQYGLEAAEIQRVLDAVTAYRSSKFQRYRRRAEFLARGVLSRVLMRRG